MRTMLSHFKSPIRCKILLDEQTCNTETAH
jgi:hypothetical protein